MPQVKKPLDSPIEMLYISDDNIGYACHECKTEFSLPFTEEEAKQGWFQFTCQTCGTKRKINLAPWGKSGKKEISLLPENP